MPPSDAPIALDELTESEAAVAANELVAELARTEHRSLRRRGWALAIAGLVVLVVAGWGIRSASGTGRALVAAAGALLLWSGLQQLGRARYGPRFRLGLWVALGWLVLVVVLAITSPLLPIDGIDEPVLADRLARPALELDQPLGRDDFGRSLLTRTIYGARVSLAVGVIGAGVGMVVGGLFGLVAGYYRGRLDGVIGIFANATLAFPPLVLLLALVSVFAKNVTNLSLGLAVLSVPTFIRLTRAQTMVYAQREFVLAARAMGARNRRIIFREILPNVLLPVASYGFLVIALLIVAEGSLSFIGLGIQPPRPSWGGMIAKAQNYLKPSPHGVFVPATAMFLTVLSLNRLGDWARRQVSGREAKV